MNVDVWKNIGMNNEQTWATFLLVLWLTMVKLGNRLFMFDLQLRNI